MEAKAGLRKLPGIGGPEREFGAVVKVTDGCFPQRKAVSDGHHVDLSAWRAMVPEVVRSAPVQSLEQMSLGHARRSGSPAPQVVETLGRRYFFDGKANRSLASLVEEEGDAGDEDAVRVCTIAPVRSQIGSALVDLVLQ